MLETNGAANTRGPATTCATPRAQKASEKADCLRVSVLVMRWADLELDEPEVWFVWQSRRYRRCACKQDARIRTGKPARRGLPVGKSNTHTHVADARRHLLAHVRVHGQTQSGGERGE